jgi:hypothetical protein
MLILLALQQAVLVLVVQAGLDIQQVLLQHKVILVV